MLDVSIDRLCRCRGGKAHNNSAHHAHGGTLHKRRSSAKKEALPHDSPRRDARRRGSIHIATWLVVWVWEHKVSSVACGIAYGVPARTLSPDFTSRTNTHTITARTAYLLR